MRILVVSAHFPPNFVSGGGSQPAHPRGLGTSRQLRQRGTHLSAWPRGSGTGATKVSVYAGWLGAARPPGSAWTTTGDDGLSVRWIAATPWIDWGDVRNHANPLVTADFARYLADVDPDVVHFHSLQSLGAGLVSAAAATRAQVVVTMHDFWWFCGRQFLVDRDFSPCCLIVDAGMCECQVDRPWLERRNALLRRVAADVDLVLSPSKSAADVLAANGIDPARLRVDENGLPATSSRAPRSQRPHAGDEELRLLYTGGSNQMKGVHVLLDAVRLLADGGRARRRPWRVVAYGIDDHLRDSGTALEGLPVEARPPFPPEQLDDVYAER